VTRLLPEYYGSHAEADTGTLLSGLAARLIARHGDRWLADALQTPHSPGAAAAFAALGLAEQAGQRWNYSAAGTEARKALPLFQAAGSAAGMMFAQLEQVFALDWNGPGGGCAQRAEALLRPSQTHSYAWLETQAMLEQGICAVWTGDLERADGSERMALSSALDSSYPVLYLRALGLNASRHAQIGNSVAAWRENFTGLARYWGGRYPLLRAHQFYSALSLMAQQSHATYSALGWARELAAVDSILGNKSVYGPTLWQLGLAELAAGLRDDAYGHLRESVAVDARMQSDARPQIDVATVEMSRGNWEQALFHLRAAQPEAQRGNELLKLQFAGASGRALLGRGDYTSARKLFEGALRIGESSWSRAPEEEHVLWSRAMASIYRGLVDCELHGATDPRQALASWSEYRARLFARGNVVSAAEDSLPPGAGRLCFAGLPSGVAAWLDTGSGLDFRWIPSPQSLPEAAGRLARACANPGSPAAVVRAEAKALSYQLLGPWDARLDRLRTLVVEADGPVAQVPWLALVRRSGHYWSEDFAVEVRAGTHGGAVAAPIESDSRALVVGAPAFTDQEGLVALPHARAEAEKVSSLFSRSTALMGRAAGLSEVRQRLAQAQLFHFSGHGYGGEGGGLLLRGEAGGPALLRAADIQGLDLSRCSLVVLASCSTAAGERGGPGDPQSLVRAFLHAGARDVVAGLWNLDSAGTQMLVDTFYKSLLSETPVSEALRNAAAAVRSDGRYAHPYYWAGLEVFSRN